MIIAAFQKKGNDVVVVFEDGSYRNIDYRIVVDHGIWKGQEVDEKKIELLSYESSLLKAKDSAFRYLGLRIHSTSELRLKLQKKKHSKEIIEKVIVWLAEQKYLNDDEFVKQFIAEKIKKKRIGTAKLAAELAKKGIKRESINENLLSIDYEKYFQNALELGKKKLAQIKGKETDDRRIVAKLFAFMATKGYESDLIRKVIQNLNMQTED